MADAVLDASALLALLNGEPGAEPVKTVLGVAAMSAVNLSEVLTVLVDRGVPRDAAEAALGDLPVEIHSFGPAGAAQAAALRPSTRSAGLSLGDRACLALAKELGVPALTADRAWQGLPTGIRVTVIR